MYGLPQVGQIAYVKLVKYLVTGGYIQAGITTGLVKQKTNLLHFCLIVDDFGVKCTDKQHSDHLIYHLNQVYKTTVDWDGKYLQVYT